MKPSTPGAPSSSTSPADQRASIHGADLDLIEDELEVLTEFRRRADQLSRDRTAEIEEFEREARRRAQADQLHKLMLAAEFAKAKANGMTDAEAEAEAHVKAEEAKQACDSAQSGAELALLKAQALAQAQSLLNNVAAGINQSRPPVRRRKPAPIFAARRCGARSRQSRRTAPGRHQGSRRTTSRSAGGGSSGDPDPGESDSDSPILSAVGR